MNLSRLVLSIADCVSQIPVSHKESTTCDVCVLFSSITDKYMYMCIILTLHVSFVILQETVDTLQKEIREIISARTDLEVL